MQPPPRPDSKYGPRAQLCLAEGNAVVLLDHVRGILDRIARLFIGAGLLQDVGGEDVADIMRSMGQ